MRQDRDRHNPRNGFAGTQSGVPDTALPKNGFAGTQSGVPATAVQKDGFAGTQSSVPDTALPKNGFAGTQSGVPDTALQKVPWPHAPPHRLSERGTYIVTAGTYRKEHHFRTAERLSVLHRGLLTVARDFGWQLEAWAVFSNHYHFVGQSPHGEKSAESLSQMLALLHQKTARWVNRLDRRRGRHVWHNFWETLLTFEKSYFARLNYVHQNAVKHGLVPVANQYPWCSAAWFERTARPAQVKTIYRFRIDAVRVYDEYEVAAEW